MRVAERRSPLPAGRRPARAGDALRSPEPLGLWLGSADPGWRREPLGAGPGRAADFELLLSSAGQSGEKVAS